MLTFTSTSDIDTCTVCCSYIVVGQAFVGEHSTAWHPPNPHSGATCVHNNTIFKQLIWGHLWISRTSRAIEVQKASKAGLVSSGICWQLYILWFDWNLKMNIKFDTTALSLCILHLIFSLNKNALRSCESRLLEDKFCCQRCRCCYTTYLFGIKNEYYMSYCKYSKRKKIARRDRQLISASNRWDTFENLLHIDIAPVRTLSGILHSKFERWFMSLSGAHDSFSINIYSFFVADQDTVGYSICSAQEKCVSLAEPYTTDS